MPLTESQAEEIKKQIITQVESTFPPETKEQAIAQIESMNTEQLEQFLIKNKLIKTSSEESQITQSQSHMQQSPFRLIISGEIPSFKIDENKDSIAVLEINPISKGHIIIIPKKEIFNIEEIPQTIFSLSKKLSKQIKEKLKPKDVSVYTTKVLGEVIINVLPVYNTESIDSERKKASEKELESLQSILGIKTKKSKTPASSFDKIKKPKVVKIKPKPSEKIWLPRRIP